MPLNEIVAALTITTALALGASALAPDHALTAPAATAVAVTTTPLPLNRDDPGATAIGALQFRGAVQLRATDPLFGGISGLRFGGTIPNGAQLLGVTDTGNWITLQTIESGGRLTGVRNVTLVPIRGADGRPAATKAQGDAEALEWNPDTGTAAIVYEQDHRIAHFAGIDPADPGTFSAQPDRIERLTAMTGWPLNGGGEAMAILPGGARVVLSERRMTEDGHHAGLLTIDGRTRDIAVAGVADHSPTDAVALDATHLLVLHRRFDLSGQGAAVTLVDLAPAIAGAPGALPARLLAQWQSPVTLDNMEGLALRRDGDRVFLYIVSDDNLSSLQRTLLMKFELVLPRQAGIKP
ncbi:esterase-like activity of phytase family protein [Polymorphobacter fuscus]|uniref:Phytase-like domain-containing protein n=1 Tax=Sandarakinorhabdus fusca TaxID=1439888 RepID=A0A7C9KZR8_9SPHN|nr:esterase-like activity of phytase family protein [Polymorphobacter fuscus]KAB7644426.1 hypothetical protein F9290_13925 [Polymorphobacter fuscus]MQT18348.1 hypothetical protein [Polymorphobacter fuscus]NJC08248.1 hypothetical protein [Polymorphobacter fuscus]